MLKYKKPIFGTKSILDHYYSHSGVRISVNITQFICKKFAHLPILEVKLQTFKSIIFCSETNPNIHNSHSGIEISVSP